MTDRTRSARDVRIVPGTAGGAAPSARGAASTSTSPSAVQLFRALAAQASLLADTDTNGSGGDDGGGNAGASDAFAESQTALPEDGACGASTDAAESKSALQKDASFVVPGPPPIAHAAANAPPSASTARKPHAIGAARARSAAPQTDDPALGEHIVRACATAAHGEVFTQQLAERITRFCSMSGAAEDVAWEVTLPMNPAVLPDTSMHLQLSPSRMVIRFETTSPYASRLIVDNAAALRTRLADVLRRQIDVDVIA